MIYENIVKGKFLERPNRFIAHCEVNGKKEVVHVKNTGKCKELLVPGTTVFLEEHNNPNRKTKFSLISVIKNNRIINMDSQVPNKVVYEALVNSVIKLPGLDEEIVNIRCEKTYKSSRFDVYIETENKKAFVEVKGVTLEEEDVVLFPDAKTERGVKHVLELVEASKDGYLAYIVFVVQMSDVKYFTPNIERHKEFGEALSYAKSQGVNILAYECNIDETSLVATKEVLVKL